MTVARLNDPLPVVDPTVGVASSTPIHVVLVCAEAAQAAATAYVRSFRYQEVPAPWMPGTAGALKLGDAVLYIIGGFARSPAEVHARWWREAALTLPAWGALPEESRAAYGIFYETVLTVARAFGFDPRKPA